MEDVPILLVSMLILINSAYYIFLIPATPCPGHPFAARGLTRRSFLRRQESSVFVVTGEERIKTLDSRLKMSGMTEGGVGDKRRG